MNILNSSLLSLVTASLLFTGCSESSDNNTPTQETPKEEAPTNTTINITGKAIDGYLQSSTVCLDLSLDGYCQVDKEPVTSTDDNGSYSLSLSPQHQEHENYKIAPLLVYDGKDSDTGKRFEGKLQAPNDGTAINITPLTTIVAKSISKEKASLTEDEIKTKIKEAEAKLKKALALDENIDLGADPIALKDTDESLIKASLSLQKSLQTLAKAGTQDDSNDKDEAELIDDMFEAMLLSLDDMGEDDEGLDILLDKMLLNEEALALMPPKSQKTMDTAKDIGKKINDSFDQLIGEDELKNLSVLIEQDLARLEKEFKEFDAQGDFTTNIPFEITDSTFDDFDFREESFKAEAALHGLTLSDEDYAKIPENIQLYNLYEDDSLEELKEVFPELYKKLYAEISDWEEIEQTSQSKFSQEIVKMDLPFTFYDIYENYESNIWDDEYTINKATFGSDMKLSFSESTLEGEELERDSAYKLSADGKWSKEPNSTNFTLNEDGTFNLPLWNEKATITSIRDIGNQEYYIPNIGAIVSMPEGASKYTIKLEQYDDEITMYQATYNSLSSFSEFIEAQCGTHYFHQSEYNDDMGLGFEGTKSETEYLCDGSQTKGNVVSGKDLEVSGTWEIIQKNGTDILVVTPLNKYYYTYNNELPAFAIIDGRVFEGSYEAKDNTEVFSQYNDVAIKAIQNALMSEDYATSFASANTSASTPTEESNL